MSSEVYNEAMGSSVHEGASGDFATPSSPALLIRSLGWSLLALLAAYLINVVLTFWFDWPGINQIFGWNTNGDGGVTLSAVQLAFYGFAVVVAVLGVIKTGARTLRQDERFIADMNGVLIRMCFWVVCFVGLADFAVSFLRVEGLLDGLVGSEMGANLGRAQFRGLYVHTPVILLGIVVGAFSRTLGFHWLALLVVAAELFIVFSRFVFSYEQAFIGDLVRFWYGALFLFASAYTLLDDGHVRVDLLYAGFRHEMKGKINRMGALLLGIPLCWIILFVGMWTKASVIVSPILVFEITQAGFGLYIKYLMTGFLGIFAVTMMIQFVSQLFAATADARGEPGARQAVHEAM